MKGKITTPPTTYCQVRKKGQVKAKLEGSVRPKQQNNVALKSVQSNAFRAMSCSQA
jgi:hypothetical protein